MADVNIADLISDLNRKVDAIYRHGTLQERYSSIPRDYGEGFVLSEAEAHTLGYVCEIGETTVTDLAAYSFRTKGTMSKMLKNLEDKGYIKRTKRDDNRKWVYVTATEKGRRADEVHRAYDRTATSVMIEALLKTCSIEDVESFYKVTEARIEYLKNKDEYMKNKE